MKFTIGTDLHGKEVKIDSLKYATQGNAVLGIIKSGKSYTATEIAEFLMEEKIPIIVFDPTGIWRNLKVGVAGHKGYPVVVIGDGGDMPLVPAGIEEAIRSAMQENVSVVIDLFSAKLSKADWRAIVEKSIRLLLYENKAYGVRHIFLEEAAEFIPQKIGPNQGNVYAEIEKLARMGGNSSLGFTVINQRAQEVNKAILELCNNLILHRQRGKNAIMSLSDWIELLHEDLLKEFKRTLSNLKQGQAWIIDGEAETAILTTIGKKKTFHPDREHPTIGKSNGKAADVSIFVSQLKARMKEYIDKVKDNDPSELKKKIKELESQLKNKSTFPSLEPKMSRELRKKLEDEIRNGFLNDSQRVNEHIRRAKTEIVQIATEIIESSKKIQHITVPFFSPEKVKIISRDIPMGEIERRTPHQDRINERASETIKTILASQEANFGKCEIMISEFLAINNDKVWSKEQVGIMTGYSPTSGGFNNALGKLRTHGIIDGPGRLLKGVKLIKHDKKYVYRIGNSYNHLPKCEREIVTVLLKHPSRDFTKEGLADMTESKYSPTSGGFNNSLGHIKTLGWRKDIIGIIALSIDAQELLERFGWEE